tara:strand:+ start:546 stop:980 length:435 start_codon:yes stop_codon:yes gene_type:complete
MKTCSKCGVEKPLEAFYRDKEKRDGVKNQCKLCEKSQKKEYYQDNKGSRSAYDKEWKKENKGKVNATTAKRKAAKLRATPAWANKEAIDYVYYAAQVLKEQFPDLPGPHIDHSIALQSKTACGLHVHENLVLMNPRDNMSKGNR